MGAVAVSLSGQLRALACPSNFYGISSDVLYGLRLRPCKECPSNQVGARHRGHDIARQAVLTEISTERLAACLPANMQVTSCDGVPSPADATCASTLSAWQVMYDGAPAYFGAGACVHRPGYGWVAFALPVGTATGSAPCPSGFYSSGGHNSSCTQCTGGLMTANEASTSANSCGEVCTGLRVHAAACCHAHHRTMAPDAAGVVWLALQWLRPAFPTLPAARPRLWSVVTATFKTRTRAQRLALPAAQTQP